MLRAAEIVDQLLDTDDNDQLATILGADRDELADLVPLLGLELSDPKACNKALATSTAGAIEGNTGDAMHRGHHDQRSPLRPGPPGTA